MKNIINPFFGLVILGLVFSAHAEQQFSFNYAGKDYFQDGKILWVTEAANGEQFQVNIRVITAKAAPHFNSVQINSYLQQNDLKILRTAITGYSDIQLTENAIYKDVLFALNNSGLFSVVEPTTFGRYLLIPNDSQYPAQ
ncbi:MAG: hypothetical protein JKY19_14980 [Alcanivoracaceae bacterium]|nr:hypothetical protein [Alcanivoracaceae bacterium]